MRYCQNCGQKIDEGADFCSRCGARVNLKGPRKQNNNKSGKALPPLLPVLLGFIALIAALFIVFVVYDPTFGPKRKGEGTGSANTAQEQQPADPNENGTPAVGKGELSDKDAGIYRMIAENLFYKYGKLRTSRWLSGMEESNTASLEVRGVCYLRLLDFDNDGDLELYAVCKNEEEESYRGLVYSVENGTTPIFDAPVNSNLGLWVRKIDLVRKGDQQFFVYVRNYEDGRGGKMVDQVFGYDPDDPGSFTYTRASSSREIHGNDGTWYPEFMIWDDAAGGEWTKYDTDEFERIEEEWWSDAEVETSLTVCSADGQVDRERMTALMKETMKTLTGEENYEVEDPTPVETGTESKEDKPGTESEEAAAEQEKEPVAEQEEEPAAEQEEESAAEQKEEEPVAEQKEESAVEQKEESAAEQPSSSDEHSPFYGIWCRATKNRSVAEDAASEMEEKGLPAEIFVSSDWSNMNSEMWYVISAGTYETKAEAESMLPHVQDYYPSAFIKYSGAWIGK